MRLRRCEHISDCVDLLNIYSEFLFRVVDNHRQDTPTNKVDADAKVVLQMVLTKILYIKNMVEHGVSYSSPYGSELDSIIDPTIVASLTRNLYETVAMFNVIYRNTKSQDEKTILYCLWVHAGLKYRQRFESLVTTKENTQKIEHERKQLDALVAEIESTSLFKSLNDKNQKKIRARLEDKEYLLQFKDSEVVFLHWQSVTKVIGDGNGILDAMYTYLSLYAHPSNVSVFQFRGMFRDDRAFLKLTTFKLQYVFYLTSVFIADYINLFPSVLRTFESLSLKDQIILNSYNVFLRGDSFAINDAKEMLR